MRTGNFLKSLFVLLVLVASSVLQAATRDPVEHFFHQSFGDLGEELTIARSEDKSGLLLMFDNAECPWCHKMKTSILNQSNVQDYFRKHFRIVRVDTEGSNPIVDFSGKEMLEKDYTLKVNRVRATPVFIFFDLSGKQVARYTGAVSSIDEFMWLGEFVAGEHYKSTNFTKYKRQRKAASGK
jgi:thioredoxin-related protein